MSEVEKKQAAPAAAATLTAEELKAIIEGAVTAAVAAAKAPNVVEQAQIDRLREKAQQDAQTRLEGSESKKQEMANRAWQKSVCSHERKNGSSRAILVQDELGGYLLCQKCQAVIRPEGQRSRFPADFTTKRQDVIFNTKTFNELFQKSDANGIMD